MVNKSTERGVLAFPHAGPDPPSASHADGPSALLNQGAAAEEDEEDSESGSGSGSEGEVDKAQQLDRHGLPVELRMDDYDEDEVRG